MNHARRFNVNEIYILEETWEHIKDNILRIPKSCKLDIDVESCITTNTGVGISVTFSPSDLLGKTFHALMKKHTAIEAHLIAVPLADGKEVDVIVDLPPHPFYVNGEIGYPADQFDDAADCVNIEGIHSVTLRYQLLLNANPYDVSFYNTSKPSRFTRNKVRRWEDE